MTDIVERLRLAPDADFYRPSKWFELMTEAAAEIERLQVHSSVLMREIERLRAALLVAQQWMPIDPMDDEAKKEIAQVRAALELKP